MRTFFGTIFLGTLVFVLSFVPAFGDSNVKASDARLRLMPGDLPCAGYLVLHNGGVDLVKLVGAHSDAFKKVEMHMSMNKDGMAHMKAVPTIEIAAGEDFEFAPSGYHLMLMKRSAPLNVGDAVVITLELDGGGSLPVTFDVVSPAAM